MSAMREGMQEAISSGIFAANAERDAQRRLAASGYQALKAIKCRVRRGALVLTGEAPTYFHKQLAQEALRSLATVYAIDNQIAVAPRRRSAYAQAPTRGGRHEN